jgi:hypothetical protein
MAYLELSTGQVDANSPLDTTLFQQIRDNQIDFNSRLSGQTIYVQTNTTAQYTSSIPYDNTRPQITEGTEVFSAVITPLSSSDRIIIDIDISAGISPSTNLHGTIALFQNSGSSAIRASVITTPLAASSVVSHSQIRHIIDPIGTTVASTFSVRIGNDSTGQPVWINASYLGGNKYGGALYSNMTITEIATT